MQAGSYSLSFAKSWPERAEPFVCKQPLEEGARDFCKAEAQWATTMRKSNGEQRTKVAQQPASSPDRELLTKAAQGGQHRPLSRHWRDVRSLHRVQDLLHLGHRWTSFRVLLPAGCEQVHHRSFGVDHQGFIGTKPSSANLKKIEIVLWPKEIIAQ